MFILTIINKIWLYLGPYYLSLIFAILLSKKYKKGIILLCVLVSLVMALINVFNNIISLKKTWTNFIYQSRTKTNYLSYKQIKLLEVVNKTVKETQIICYPWPSDISGRYAQQYLYPKYVILSPDSLSECNYLVLDYTIGYKNYELAHNIIDKDTLIFNELALGQIYLINK